MKIPLLLALSLAFAGATVLAAAPGATACYDSCVVGPCEVSFRPLFTMDDPTGTVQIQPSVPSGSCNV